MKKIPTFEEYKKAKKIVSAYEQEQKRLYDLRVEAFKIDLKEYFDNNLLDGFIKIELFTLGKDNFGCGEIIPLVPNVDEYYEGGNNSDIEKICKKHDVNFKMAYWCYSK